MRGERVGTIAGRGDSGKGGGRVSLVYFVINNLLSCFLQTSYIGPFPTQRYRSTFSFTSSFYEKIKKYLK